MKKVYYIGLDVHKETVQMAVVTSESPETIENRKMGSSDDEVVNAVKKYAEMGKVVTGYETGCTGYGLYRTLKNEGIECVVLPANKVAEKRKDKIKTDKRDARLIARALRSGEVRGIEVPTEEDEATRDFLRMRDDIKGEVKRAKAWLTKFLLRKGYKWNDEHTWTHKHWEWMDGIRFEYENERATYAEYRILIKGYEEQVKRLDKRIEEIAESERYREEVRRLRVFRGIDYQTGLALVVEVGDFRRFEEAKSFMSYLGLVPKESSSGGTRRQGGITKAGNAHLRKLMIEAAWHYVKKVEVGETLKKRREGQKAELIGHADKAMRYLNRMYIRLVLKNGKRKVVAATAVARELSGFVWAVGSGRIDGEHGEGKTTGSLSEKALQAA